MCMAGLVHGNKTSSGENEYNNGLGAGKGGYLFVFVEFGQPYITYISLYGLYNNI